MYKIALNLGDRTVFNILKKGKCHKIFDFRLFQVIFSGAALIIPAVPLQFFFLINENIRSSRYATGINHTVDNGGIYRQCQRTSGHIVLELCTDCDDTGGKLPSGSVTSAASCRWGN
jgi:hypothetical protein